MVNLVDAFTKTHGRAPTMKEVDAMHELKKDQKKFLELKQRVEKQQLEEALPPRRKNRRRHPVPLRVPKDAQIANRLLLRKVPKDDIAYALDITLNVLENMLRKWDLPRMPR